jgi:hypothetical protein
VFLLFWPRNIKKASLPVRFSRHTPDDEDAVQGILKKSG